MYAFDVQFYGCECHIKRAIHADVGLSNYMETVASCDNNRAKARVPQLQSISYWLVNSLDKSLKVNFMELPRMLCENIE